VQEAIAADYIRRVITRHEWAAAESATTGTARTGRKTSRCVAGRRGRRSGSRSGRARATARSTGSAAALLTRRCERDGAFAGLTDAAARSSSAAEATTTTAVAGSWRDCRGP